MTTKLYPFDPWPGAMINSQLLKQPMSRTNFHGPKDVLAIEVRLHVVKNCSLNACANFSSNCITG